MAKNQNDSMVNYASPLAEPIEIMCGATRLRIKDETMYTDKDTHERKVSKRAITLQSLGMEFPMKIPAFDLGQLVANINENEQIKGILRARIAEEYVAPKTF